MWRNLKFLHSWHVYGVENVYVHIMLFCWKMGFVVIYAVCREICFDAIYALLCGEKLNQRLHMWRKNDKYQVWWWPHIKRKSFWTHNSKLDLDDNCHASDFYAMQMHESLQDRSYFIFSIWFGSIADMFCEQLHIKLLFWIRSKFDFSDVDTLLVPKVSGWCWF